MPISYCRLLLPYQKSRLAKPMGNAESSSGRGGGHGEKEEEKREQEQQDTKSGLQKALMVAAAAAATTAVVAYRAYKLQAKVEANLRTGSYNESITAGAAIAVWSSSSEEEEEEERMADPWKRERADEASAGKSIVHSCPSETRFMLNTDFSGPSAMGLLIRGSDGVMLWCLAQRVESCVIKNNRGETICSYPSQLDGGVPIDKGEALVLLKGLEIARDRGYRNLVALTDNQPNVLSINSTNNKKKGEIIQQIRDAKFNWFERCEIKHVKREGNRCANHLAHVAATRGPSSFEELKDSPDLLRLLQEDKDNLFNSFFSVVPASGCVQPLPLH